METVVIGCGNLLRGDDGVGPCLIRYLWERGQPPGVRLVDGGTAGMDVAFQMRGAEKVILVDACRSDSPAGTTYAVPGAQLESLPPLGGINLHAFRWDHALAFARWLLKDEYPRQIEVYLIEIASLEPGAALTPAVDQAMRQLGDRLLAQLAPVRAHHGA